MKIILWILCLFTTLPGFAQVHVTIDNGINLIADSSLNMVIDSGALVNNGSYVNNSGAFIAAGGVTFSGSGATSLFNVTIDNAGVTNINAPVSVFNTANLIAGRLNANNMLFIRSDMSSTANMLVSGVLTGNVKGIIAKAPVVSALCSLTANLSLNISGAPIIYQWQTSNDSASWSNVSGAHSSTLTAPVTSPVYYRCRLSASNSSYDAFTPGVKLSLLQAPVTPLVSIATGTGDTVCAGTLTAFTAVPVNGGLSPSYEWTVNGATAGSGSSFVYTPAYGDIVSVALTSNALCATPANVSTSDTLVVDSTAVPQFQITAAPGGPLKPAQYDTLSAALTNTGFLPAYQWMVNGTYVAGATSATFISNMFSDGDSVVCYVVNNGHCGTIVVGQAYVIRLQNVGVQNITVGSSILIYPNPNNGAFTLNGHLNTNPGTEIFYYIENMLGQQVSNGKITAKSRDVSEQINVSDKLQAGVYLFHVITSTKHAVQRFLIE